MKKAIPGIVVFAMLLLPAFLWIVGQRGSVIENRARVEWPAATRSGIATADYFRTAEDAVVDGIPLRQDAVRWNAEAMLRLFNESSGPKVVVGRDGWIFYKRAVKQQCFGTVAEESVDSIERANSLMQYLGKSVYVLIAPDKATVYADLVPSGGCAAASAESIAESTDTLESAAYPYRTLVQMRPADIAEEQPYFQWDSHWNWLGASAGAKATVELLDSTLWNDAHVVRGELQENSGDLAKLLGIERTDLAFEYRSDRPGVTTEQIPMEGLEVLKRGRIVREPGQRFESTSTESRLIDGTTLLLHDSFGWKMLPTLAPYFSSLTTTRYNFVDDASKRRIEGADRLIVEYVQRNYRDRVKRRPLDEELAAIFADEFVDLEFAAERDNGKLVVRALLDPVCTGAYIIVERPSDAGGAGLAVNGVKVEYMENSRAKAFWSPTATWTIEGSESSPTDEIRAVTWCGGIAGSDTRPTEERQGPAKP